MRSGTAPLIEVLPLPGASTITTGELGGQLKAKTLIVCFSHLRWDFVWQRPQHLLTRAAAEFEVLYIEEPAFEMVSEPRLILQQRQGALIVTPTLPRGASPSAAVASQRELIAELLKSVVAPRRIFWYYTPMAHAFSSTLDRDFTVYDNMDDLSAFKDAPAGLLMHEAQLLEIADVVFTGGESLFQAKRGRHPNIHAFPSSVDVAHFLPARQYRTMHAASGEQSMPRIGFCGVIDERLDIDLLDRLAEIRPDWIFEMAGPIVKIDPAILPRRPNIQWPGLCPYAELPRRFGRWDVGFMPFALNEATRRISPTKTLEYLAAGLPVVSTPIEDILRLYAVSGLVEITRSPQGFADTIEAAMTRNKDPWLKAVDRHLRMNSWDGTWSSMRRLLLASSETGLGAKSVAVQPIASAVGEV